MDQTENKENMEAMEEEQIVVITDDEGNELYFREEMVVPVGKKNFAILAQINLETANVKMKIVTAMNMRKTKKKM